MSAITVFHYIPKSLQEALQLDPAIKASWEQKALEALERSNDTETKLIIQLVPTNNLSAIEEVLRKREDPRLCAILAVVQREQRANPPPATPELTSLSFSTQAGHRPTSSAVKDPIGQGPGGFVDDLHNNAVTRFREISFVSLVRYVFGIEEHIIRGFLQWASDLSRSLHTRYMHWPQKREDYEEVEQILCEHHRDPIAHWIVASSLGLVSTSVESVIEPLVDAIRELYAKQNFDFDRLAIIDKQFSRLLASYEGDLMALAEEMSKIGQTSKLRQKSKLPRLRTCHKLIAVGYSWIVSTWRVTDTGDEKSSLGQGSSSRLVWSDQRRDELPYSLSTCDHLSTSNTVLESSLSKIIRKHGSSPCDYLTKSGTLTEWKLPGAMHQMTDSQIAERYTFVRLDNPGFDEAHVEQILDDNLGDHWKTPSVCKLSSSSWELVVYQESTPEIRNKLKDLFPSCDVELDSDPTAPSQADIDQLGSVQARSNTRQHFLERAKEMQERAWPTVRVYYAFRVDEEMKKMFGIEGGGSV